MEGHKIGYIRVSSTGQNKDKQLDGLRFNQTFVDKASGKDINRPALTEMLKFVRKGDHVVVHSLDRIARNLVDLRRIVADLTGRGISIEFVKEKLTFSGENSPMATLLLSVMGAFAEFERSLIRERQLEGIAIAKQAGAYKGRKREMTDERIAEIRQRVANGDKKAVIAREMKISRETLYQYL
ncbi:MAG: recombinase family protein [Geobacteraceae bacterium]|nr:recombinase family protein [Geobacteraceae bacterium]NTW79085.1 recombinase family protein [Geobacteraceae bacterium]